MLITLHIFLLILLGIFILLTLMLITLLTYINMLIKKMLIVLITKKKYYRISKNCVIKLLISMFIIIFNKKMLLNLKKMIYNYVERYLSRVVL